MTVEQKLQIMLEHACFVEARCPDGATVGADIRWMIMECKRLRQDLYALEKHPAVLQQMGTDTVDRVLRLLDK